MSDRSIAPQSPRAGDLQEQHSQQEWKSNGREQGGHLMQPLLGALPEGERCYLTLAKPTVLHCGCGSGDGADEIRRAFPSTNVCGLDLARSAIEQAVATYPEIEFLMSSEAVFGLCLT